MDLRLIRRCREPKENHPRHRFIDRSRIGHYARNVPAGYLDTLRTGKDCFLDRELAAYYKEMSLVVRGPLFTRARWSAIWRLNTGQLDGEEVVQMYIRKPGSSVVRPLKDLRGFERVFINRGQTRKIAMYSADITVRLAL